MTCFSAPSCASLIPNAGSSVSCVGPIPEHGGRCQVTCGDGSTETHTCNVDGATPQWDTIPTCVEGISEDNIYISSCFPLTTAIVVVVGKYYIQL